MLLCDHPHLQWPNRALYGVPCSIETHGPILQQLVLHRRLVAAVVVLTGPLEDVGMPPSVQELLRPIVVAEHPDPVVDAGGVHSHQQRDRRRVLGKCRGGSGPRALGRACGGRGPRRHRGDRDVAGVHVDDAVQRPLRIHEERVAVGPQDPVVARRVVQDVANSIHLPEERLVLPVVDVHATLGMWQDLVLAREHVQVVAVQLCVQLVVLYGEHADGLVLRIGADRDHCQARALEPEAPGRPAVHGLSIQLSHLVGQVTAGEQHVPTLQRPGRAFTEPLVSDEDEAHLHGGEGAPKPALEAQNLSQGEICGSSRGRALEGPVEGRRGHGEQLVHPSEGLLHIAQVDLRPGTVQRLAERLPIKATDDGALLSDVDVALLMLRLRDLGLLPTSQQGQGP
mmetsp:Transcript_153612/g.492376  ORF Transcript_153612/g.492376 Transcript_153612/m.492376 type:complete len:397 (-) Transcript_153612:58-1248(-)